MKKVEFIGYSARASAYNRMGKLMPYIIPNAYVFAASALFATSIYMTLERVIYAVKGDNIC